MTANPMDPFPTAAPRKRRRRAAATGAADDCFTCSSSQVKCDRRRPYCSQCLDSGKECSGYKTTLTWGVGVASRGKLRGLSLPIPGQKKEDDGPVRKKRNTMSDNDKQTLPKLTSLSPPETHVQDNPPTTCTFNFAPAESNSIPPVTSSTPTWHPVIPSTQQSFVPTYTHTHNPPVHHALHARIAPAPSCQDYAGPRSAETTRVQSQTEYASPSVDEHYHPLMQSPDTTFQNKGWRPIYDHLGYDDHRHTNWPRNSLDSSVGSSSSGRDYLEPVYKTTSFENPRFLDNTRNEIQGTLEEGDEEVEEIYHGNSDSNFGDPSDDEHMAAMLRPFVDQLPKHHLSLSHIVPSLGIGKTPRLKYLINYYAEVIAPVIVAFDGPTNPYKTHILPLAMRSETLQHAIAALSASNLRIRKEQNAISTGKTLQARRSSIAHSSLTDEKWEQQLLFLQSEDPSREELFHKGVSIQWLNAQLADPSRRKDDSILATLLVLCLFHICDTGVAKFKTQFAGVKKLLALRQNELDRGTKETKWYTRMFTWFDAFTATVNDREGQLSGGLFDLASLSDEEWSMENLAGCDGRLFKIISRLGRLNVLSQNKPVEGEQTIPVRVPRANPFFRSSPFDHSNSHLFDGNGWASLLADEDIFNTHDDCRAQFWREWKDIRQSLEEWELDMSIYDPTCIEICGPNHDDLVSISESFRYSALLYTERLAFPQIPSSHPKIQFFVQHALHFITQVKSDVYLLWPLFITGSECVERIHRHIIRQRCLDIQKDSGFFNNISCLELLEKVWCENPTGETVVEMGSAPKIGGQGFRWRKVMSSGASEGEYIVV